MTGGSDKLVAVPLADLEQLVARSRRRWLSVADASDYCGLSQESVRRLLSAGKLTGHRPVRGKILIDRLQLDAVIAASSSQPRTGRGRSVGTAAAREKRREK